MRKFLFIFFLLLLLKNIAAQDPNFSQFFVSPLTLNPAMAGKFNGDFRIAGNYRDQWPAFNKAFITSTLSFDLGILRNRLSDVDTWGLGIMAMTDKTANGIFSGNLISITTAYHKGIDENGLHQVGIGFQANYVNKRLDGTKLNFEEELDLQGGWTNPSGESIDGREFSVSYFDMNLGGLYNGSTDGYNNFYFGASVYHINKPKESFSGDIFYTLNPRVTVHAGGAIPMGDRSRTVYLSSLVSRQAGATNIVAGGAIGLLLNENEENATSFYAGVWGRVNNISDAIIPYVGMEFGGFRIGASYDVNISSLKAGTQSRGGIEISLIYIKRPPGYKAMPCPRF